jgi:hypothetical protein
MTIALSSTFNGATVNGLTSPTYTVTADQPPNPYSKQWYVSGKGGTQTSVDSSSTASKPWTFTFTRPPVLKALNSVDVTGVLRQVGFNTYEFLMRRGLVPLTGQAPRVCNWRASFPVLVGADTADTANLRAAVSSFVGALSDSASGLSDSMIAGSL